MKRIPHILLLLISSIIMLLLLLLSGTAKVEGSRPLGYRLPSTNSQKIALDYSGPSRGGIGHVSLPYSAHTHTGIVHN
uniref:Uncharacterized protein n=1 Tax=Manihot esculenta TaxID=3983 RepID=A0A2C9U0G6_MANES